MVKEIAGGGGGDSGGGTANSGERADETREWIGIFDYLLSAGQELISRRPILRSRDLKLDLKYAWSTSEMLCVFMVFVN